MSVYLKNIVAALVAFPFVAFVFTLPYAVLQYKKYGSIPLAKVVVVYSMVLYFICAYFMVILPLPERAEVAQMTSPVIQLIPFHFISDIVMESGLVLSEPSTYLTALKSSPVLVVVFNIVMFIPFGIYMRYYYRQKWYKVLLFSFALSLLFEITQLSGLYGIYPRAYRLFDIDDLLLNTAGAMLGYLVSPLFMKILPSRDRLDELSYKRGRKVSLPRRLAAAFVDWFCVDLLSLGISLLCDFSGIDFLVSFVGKNFIATYVLSAAAVFILLPILTRGYTPGKFAVGIRLACAQGVPKYYHYIIRYGLLYGIILPCPFWSVFFAMLSKNGGNIFVLIGMFIAVGSVYVYIKFAVDFILTGIKNENRFVYEKLSRIYNISTVRVPDEEDEGREEKKEET